MSSEPDAESREQKVKLAVAQSLPYLVGRQSEWHHRAVELAKACQRTTKDDAHDFSIWNINLATQAPLSTTRRLEINAADMQKFAGNLLQPEELPFHVKVKFFYILWPSGDRRKCPDGNCTTDSAEDANDCICGFTMLPALPRHMSLYTSFYIML